MSVRVISWVWEHSNTEPTERLVLLAIADCANDAGAEAYPSLATLAKKTGLSIRSVQRALRRLVECGELIVNANAGPHGCNRYRVTMTPGTVSPPSESHPVAVSPRQADTPAHSHPTPVRVSPPPRQDVTPTPVTVSPEPSFNRKRTVSEPSKAVAVASDGQQLSITQRSKRITDAYSRAEPMCKWPAVNGVVMKAIKAEKWSDDEIGAALLRLADEGRSVTVETLRIELNGLPPPKRSTTNSRVNQALAIADELERKEIES